MRKLKKQDIEPSENNVIKLDPIKKEPKVFEETLKAEEQSEKPLVLSDEVVDQAPTINNTQSQTLSPAVRKIVAENKIDLATVKGSGKDGRVLKGDLISMMGANPKPSERKIQYGQEERIKMTRLRQTIAKKIKAGSRKCSLTNNIQRSRHDKYYANEKRKSGRFSI